MLPEFLDTSTSIMIFWPLRCSSEAMLKAYIVRLGRRSLLHERLNVPMICMLRGHGKHVLEASRIKFDYRGHQFETHSWRSPDGRNVEPNYSNSDVTKGVIFSFAPFHSQVIISFCNSDKPNALNPESIGQTDRICVRILNTLSERFSRTGSMNASISRIFPSVSNWSRLTGL